MTEPRKDALADLEEFAKLLTAEDELGSVIRAHLVLEFHMDRLIELAAPNAAAVAAMELDFFGRVQLLSVLGFKPSLTKPLANIGSLRNSFAHRLNFKLSTDRMQTLYNCFDGEGKQIVQNAYDATRKQRLASKHPKKMWALEPKDQFSLLAAAMRVILQLALQQQTDGR